jgi:hypothetical protein
MAGISTNRTNINLPTEVAQEIMQKVQEQSAVMQLARQIPLPGRGVTIPVITGDPEAGWVEETGAKPVSNPTLATKVMQAYKLAVIVPFSDEFRIRYRIDGALYEIAPPPKNLAIPVISRIKVMSGLNIAERRHPQDGRIELRVNRKPVDIRVNRINGIMVSSLSVFRLMEDRGTFNFNLACREITLKVPAVVIGIPKTPFYI